MFESTRPSLLSRVRDPSNHQAWVEFDARYRDLITHYCRRCGLSLTDAEDVRQMVMMRLARILQRFKYDPALGRFHDYLYRVTRSALADFRRCPEARFTDVVDDGALESVVGAATEDDPLWEQEWLDHHVRLALATVRRTFDPRSVAVFERLLAGTNVESAATEFGMTPDAVHKAKQRVRDRMQELIAEQIREENTVE